ncbi:hypothetical protein EV193_11231 [Herbihabitans rhizosphaerae]|uniref:Amidase domain-containing protein n=1 Tax=Herbihabitans rhizosphaerae TaxID=1872711 RepID=A0A4Q7KHP9_9PSEU|nr:hypothetical protein [Herbihabitans rhizosphaerae]RZS32398.1 hypothetical protein EV193_11231 [Herbihabitans rhizosphaerae]
MFATSFLGVVPAHANASNPEERNDERDILGLSVRYLEERADRATVGGPDATHISVATTNEMRWRLGLEFTELDSRTARLEELDGGYRAAKVDVTPHAVKVLPGSAEVDLTESTKLFYSRLSAPDAPSASEYRLRRKLTFAKVAEGWRLADDRADVPRGSIGPFTYVSPSTPLRLTTPGTATPPLGAPLAVAGTSGGNHLDKKEMSSRSYDYGAMIDYARRRALGRNPEYASFGNDCMNFVLNH